MKINLESVSRIKAVFAIHSHGALDCSGFVRMVLATVLVFGAAPMLLVAGEVAAQPLTEEGARSAAERVACLLTRDCVDEQMSGMTSDVEDDACQACMIQASHLRDSWKGLIEDMNAVIEELSSQGLAIGDRAYNDAMQPFWNYRAELQRAWDDQETKCRTACGRGIGQISDEATDPRPDDEIVSVPHPETEGSGVGRNEDTAADEMQNAEDIVEGIDILIGGDGETVHGASDHFEGEEEKQGGDAMRGEGTRIP